MHPHRWCKDPAHVNQYLVVTGERVLMHGEFPGAPEGVAEEVLAADWAPSGPYLAYTRWVCYMYVMYLCMLYEGVAEEVLEADSAPSGPYLAYTRWVIWFSVQFMKASYSGH